MKYPRPMHDAASRLTDKEYRFIRKEFGITKKELLHLSEDLLIELYDELCNIEVTLSVAKGRASIRGHTAAGIAALLGDALRIHNENGDDDWLDRYSYLSAHVPAVLKENNMPTLRFHDLRHSCASLLFSQGVSLKEIQAWLGHSTIGTTANIYTHLGENYKLSSANAILSILPEK